MVRLILILIGTLGLLVFVDHNLQKADDLELSVIAYANAKSPNQAFEIFQAKLAPIGDDQILSLRFHSSDQMTVRASWEAVVS